MATLEEELDTTAERAVWLGAGALAGVLLTLLTLLTCLVLR
jgi:hypothetical protein